MPLGDFDYLVLKVLRAHAGRWQRSGDLIREVAARDASAYPKRVTRSFLKLESQQLAQRRGEDANREWRAMAAGAVNKDALRPPVDLAVALLKLRQLANSHLPTTVTDGLADYFGGAVRVLEENVAATRLATARAWIGKTTRVDGRYSLIAPQVREGVLDVVLDALYQDACIEIYYQNGRTSTVEPRRFTILPLALVEKGPVLYLVADRPSTGGGTKRHLLRMDRIHAAAACDVVLARDTAFSLDAYVRDERTFDFFSEPPVEMVLRVREVGGFHSPFRELKFSKDQAITEVEGGFTLTATVTPSIALSNLLLERADAVEVVSPAALRANIVGRLRHALDVYGEAHLPAGDEMEKSGHG